MGKIQKLIEAIKGLDLTNKELLTGDGTPKVDVLEAAIDDAVSAAERDEAWKIYQVQLEAVPATVESAVPNLDGASHVVTMEGGKAVTKWFRDGKLIYVGTKPEATDEAE